MIYAFVRNLGYIFGRDLEADLRRLPPLGRLALLIVFALTILIFVSEVIRIFSPSPTVPANLEPVADGPAGIQKNLETRIPTEAATGAEPAAAAARFTVDGKNGLAASFDVAAPGEIVGWQFYFAFTTPCERDLRARLVSPEGRNVVVMDRGLQRCSGTSQTWSSLTTDDGGAFAGSSGDGTWTFTMQDLDRNGHAAQLDAVWMTLQVKQNGAVTPYTVTLDGLPRDIPEPE